MKPASPPRPTVLPMWFIRDAAVAKQKRDSGEISEAAFDADMQFLEDQLSDFRSEFERGRG